MAIVISNRSKLVSCVIVFGLLFILTLVVGGSVGWFSQGRDVDEETQYNAPSLRYRQQMLTSYDHVYADNKDTFMS
ncbi:hypothetical protein M8J75_008229 [Diaphorina citri]|nr:hypothetical protein M8J75_008229 [Diaphorina citri]